MRTFLFLLAIGAATAACSDTDPAITPTGATDASSVDSGAPSSPAPNDAAPPDDAHSAAPDAPDGADGASYGPFDSGGACPAHYGYQWPDGCNKPCDSPGKRCEYPGAGDPSPDGGASTAVMFCTLPLGGPDAGQTIWRCAQ
jgi:hypothetical protein